MQSKLYEWSIFHFFPYARITWCYTSFTGWKYKRGYSLLKPGDIVLVKDNKKMVDFLIPGPFSHAALCVSKEPSTSFEIAEMTHQNFTRSCFFDLCHESDRVVIVRCEDWDPKYVQKVIRKCKTFSDRKYNDQFKFGVKALYCSELIVVSDIQKRLKVDYADLMGLGRPYISPSGLYEAKNIRVIWDSDKEKL